MYRFCDQVLLYGEDPVHVERRDIAKGLTLSCW